ncbi:uncharacterized protein LAESUDRAFT_564783 [Laetiporus sulphureus 93-53]|uniref:Uncharacterized protein n=1 Tax=Laetiporus sulphureus 93-53 TaxID=1314785 RepID=A0A165FEW3_9APHY|nr:uncharacterized protein LAESUDRAFT_564783 [Laetiporus sulphureus 93-53]KZT08865.1 hypothetical protein LAESUDRAFT_564783 [Laetiporus sulphureus 93-53]
MRLAEGVSCKMYIHGREFALLASTLSTPPQLLSPVTLCNSYSPKWLVPGFLIQSHLLLYCVSTPFCLGFGLVFVNNKEYHGTQNVPRLSVLPANVERIQASHVQVGQDGFCCQTAAAWLCWARSWSLISIWPILASEMM